MERPDILRVTWDQNPAVKEALQGKGKPGDKLTYEVRCQLKDMDEEGVTLIVEAVVPEGYEIDRESDGSSTPMSPTSSDAIPQPTAMMVKRKSDY